MCLSLPAQVVFANGLHARVRIGNPVRDALNGIGARENEWVRIQQGVIVEKIDDSEQNAVVRAWKSALTKKKKAKRNSPHANYNA